MKPLVIYHADCQDGFAAAFAAWLKLGDEAEYLPMQYGKDYSKSENTFDFEGREIYILDFSFPRPLMERIFANAKRVVWIDHHKSAFEMWFGGVFNKNNCYIENDGNRYIVLDDNKSGALLSWEYFHPDTEVPMLIRHIDDRDRWVFALEGSKELHAALASLKPWSFEQWRDLFMAERGNEEVFFPVEKCQVLRISGAAILRAQDAHIQSMLKQARKCCIDVHVEGDKVRKALEAFSINPDPTFTGLALNTPMHISEVGHELANQSGTFGLVWYVGADNRVKLSFRSNAPYDVSVLAKALGGGGHAQAAGAETDIETLMGWLK